MSIIGRIMQGDGRALAQFGIGLSLALALFLFLANLF